MKKLWFLDDNRDILEVVELVLKATGYEVRTFVDGQSLLRAALAPEADLPALIILDILLSGEDGRDICKTLKNRKETAAIPVVMCSANSSAGNIAVVEYGAEAFLAKPFDIDDLMRIIEQHAVAPQHKERIARPFPS